MNMKNIIFWENLKSIYDYFENKHKLPNITINHLNGKYIINGY